MNTLDTRRRIVLCGFVFAGGWLVAALLVAMLAWQLAHMPWWSLWTFAAPKRLGGILGIGLIMTTIPTSVILWVTRHPAPNIIADWSVAPTTGEIWP